MTRRVYRRLADLARTLLEAGTSVVIDAACLVRWQRGELATVAREAAVPLVWLELDLPDQVVIERMAARLAAGGDPSDASPEVVRGQRAAREPISPAELAAEGGAARLMRVSAADLAAAASADRIVASARSAIGSREP
jgi:predicted kinase